MSVRFLLFAFTVLCAALLVEPRPSRAQAAPAPTAPRESLATTQHIYVPCGLTGRASFVPDTPILDETGRAIARFSGAETTLTISGFLLGGGERARVETGNGRGAFRVRGFVETARLPLLTVDRLPIAPGHLWIGKDREVTVVGASADKFKIERMASPPLRQKLSAWATCRSLKLTAGVPPSFSPAGFARGYVLERDSLELFDGPSGRAIGVLYRAPEAVGGVLFFSTERSGAWVHVEYGADIVVDAWARASDLVALAPGETMDQLALPTPRPGAPRLKLPAQPRLVRTTHEVPLRITASDAARPIGIIETGTDTFVLDVMAGWVSVVPQALDVMPLDGARFWVKKSELGG